MATSFSQFDCRHVVRLLGRLGFFFLFLPFFFASGSAPEEVGSDMSRPSIEAVVRFKGTRVEYTDL